MSTVLVVMDSLRLDSALLHADLLNLTNWDAILPCGAQAPYTPSSLTTLATGQFPSQHRFWNFPPRTGGPPPAANNYIFNWDVPVAWFSTNFPSTYAWPGAYSIRSAANAAAWLKAHPDGILYVHVWESHIPYEHTHWNIGEAISDMGAMEILEDRIRYTHHGVDIGLDFIKPIIDVLSDDDVLMITGDHGESLGEPNPITNAPKWLHEHVFFEEMQVPLFIKGFEPAVNFARHVDIVPTLAQLHDVPFWDTYPYMEEWEEIYGPMSLITGTLGEHPYLSWAVCRWRYDVQNWSEIGVLDAEGNWAAQHTSPSEEGITLVGDKNLWPEFEYLKHHYGEVF